MKFFDITEPDEIKPISKEIVVGIDFGTTNSLLCYVDQGELVYACDTNGEALISSIVAIEENGNDINIDTAIVGYKALHASDKRIVKSVKRLLNTPISKETHLQNIQIASKIFGHLKDIAYNDLGISFSKAVVTVPAYFDEPARQSIKEAARLADINVIRLLSEPTAAALAYKLGQTDNETIGKSYLIYDLGGGTFDVTILKMHDGVLQVIASSGDSNLGGDDIDVALLDYLCKTYDLKMDRSFDVLLQIRKMKESISVGGAFHGLIFGAHIELDKQKLNEIAAPFIQTTLNITKAALKDANLTLHDIEDIVLVGGSTKLSCVRDAIESAFGKIPLTSIDPDKSVVSGAAYQAHNLSSGAGSLLLDVVPLSLSIEVADGLTEKIIYRNTAIPAARKMTFATQKDGQTGVVIHVLQGESELANHCRSLGKFELSGLPSLPAGSVKVEIEYKLDSDGLLNVHAKDVNSNKSIDVTLKPSYGLTEEMMLNLI